LSESTDSLVSVSQEAFATLFGGQHLLRNFHRCQDRQFKGDATSTTGRYLSHLFVEVGGGFAYLFVIRR
jgi:hypothetical protein